MEEDPRFVTLEECRARASAFEINISGMAHSINKFNLALFGADGRGGIQHEITGMHATLKAIEKTLNSRNKTVVATQEISVKRLSAYTALISSAFAALASIIVAWFTRIRM